MPNTNKPTKKPKNKIIEIINAPNRKPKQPILFLNGNKRKLFLILKVI